MSETTATAPTTTTLSSCPKPAKVLLLDMDGVLAEVSKSYRAAILATCHAFGATQVTFDTISDAKAKGGANNDWVLSLKLIEQYSPSPNKPTLEQVTATFEESYQGTASKPGLCQLESLIPTRETLTTLHQRTNGQMAIVTGRPRSDCQAFLQRHDIGHYFAHAVCMEDGPAKPNPFPVQRACELLGVDNDEKKKGVLMVGDTPDDVRAALAAGCRPIGVVTPEDAAQAAKEGRPFDSSKLARAMKDEAEVIFPPGLTELLDFFPASAAGNA